MRAGRSRGTIGVMIIGPLLLTAALAIRPSQSTRRPRRGYVQGSLLLSHHSPSGATYHRVDPNLKGNAADVVLTAGGYLTPSLALEGEFVYGGRVSAGQQFRYTFNRDYVAGNRDVLITELVRYRPDGRGRLEIVAGGGYARTRDSTTSLVEFEFNGPRNSLPDEMETLHALTLTAGMDLVLPASARSAVVPSVRLRWIHRPEPAGRGWNGIGSYALQFGVGVRVR